ncbi:DUF4403 family protein [Flavobacterium selenitireducens]|uniref:DUF4403 family protein n=1 Tax=Flavobacterium selenitireducens TaxID=2722704 RepID=UPI00168B1F79|nr:DUF4403 family protein [Flavobacterium selenitireducens]MBD3582392.1 DUF4403 family protein [Flavobacterium selenitireducens]
MTSKNIVLASIGALLLSSCSSTQKIDALRPDPDNATPLMYETAPSFIDLPVKIKLKDIENQTNKYLTGLIYEDKNIEDDDLQMQVWKQGPIALSNENGRIKTVLPLKVNVKYRIGTKSLGVDLTSVREFNLNGRVTLLSNVGLTNWKLATKTELKSIDWSESPTTTVMGKQVPITYVVNPAIKLYGYKMEKAIDDAIEKSMDFKPQVLDALEKLSAPIQMSEAYESWLRTVPTEIYSTEAKLQKDVIELEMGLKCTMETFVGKKPEAKFDRNKIVLKPVSKMPDHFTANIAAVSTYADASRIMSQNFAGQEYGDGSKKVKVNKVNIWHKSGKMIIALDMTGSLNGTIYLAGFPQYNSKTQEIYFDQLDYVLDTKSKLMRTANWLMNGYILKKMQESCRYSIKPNLEEGRKNMMPYLSNYSPMPGVFVNGSVGDINFGKIQLTNQAIIAFVTVNGKLDVKIDGLK